MEPCSQNFLLKIFFIFQERNIQNPNTFITRSIFRTETYPEHYQNICDESLGKTLPSSLFSPDLKNKKNSRLKKFLYFRQRELSKSNIKKFLIL